MKKFLTLLLLACFATTAFSQAQVRNCNHTDHQHALMQDPAYAQAHYERQIRFNNVELQVSIEGRAQCANPTVLPMAVHFQGINNPSEVCLVALAEQQVQILNDDYAGTNADITNWTNGDAAGFPGAENGETCIAFCLGTTNHPSGFGLIDGQPAVTFNQFNGDSAPEFSGYINIFVRNIGGGILGYSPLGGQGNGDGVTIGTSFFSSGAGCTGVSPQAPFNQGRTLTHELGHYLNLNHIWGDGDCNIDDGIVDTPTQGNENYGCPGSPSTCGSLDMHMNYMDYVDDACMYMFSAGQSIRMENYVAANLQNVANNFATVCNITPQAPITSFNASTSTGCAPLSTTFSDVSGGIPTAWLWSFPGGSPSDFSGQTPPAVTYAEPGGYTVTLTTTNDQGTDTETMQITVQDCSSIDCNPVDNLNGGALVLIEDTDSETGGYVTGHNGFEDIAKAEYFSNLTGVTQIDGVEYSFGFASGSGSIEFVIWDDNGGVPGAELATTMVPVSTISADVSSNSNTVVDFGNLVNIPASGSFFAGFKLVNDGTNTVGLNSNSDGETSPSTATELWSSDEMWHTFDNTTNSWELEISLAIYPNLCSIDVATDDIKGLTSMDIFPNPVSGTFFIELTTSESLDLDIEIFDVTGRKVISEGTISVMGNTSHPIDASNLTTGAYFVRITNGSSTVTTKVLKF